MRLNDLPVALCGLAEASMRFLPFGRKTIPEVVAEPAVWDTLLSSLPSPLALVAASAVALLLSGHVVANFPLKRLGTNYAGGYNTRVLGYDSARGEFSLLATAAIFGPLLVLLLHLPEALLPKAAISLVLFLLWYRFAMHASHPGGARAHRILREPQWPDKTWYINAGWRCEVAEASHKKTQESSPYAETLTGEAAGRQTWHHTPSGKEDEVFSVGFNPSVNPNPEDEVWRAQRVAAWRKEGKRVPDESWKPTTTLEYLRKALSWYEVLQSPDGHWAGDYGGPHFLLPGLVVVWYITGRLPAVLDTAQQEGAAHYLRVHQQTDGGWGMHIESPSTMFGSVMCYVALRLLGEDASEPAMVSSQ